MTWPGVHRENTSLRAALITVLEYLLLVMVGIPLMLFFPHNNHTF